MWGKMDHIDAALSLEGSKATRSDITTDIFSFPKLQLYASDGEGDEPEEINLRDAAQLPSHNLHVNIASPHKVFNNSLEATDPPIEQGNRELSSFLAQLHLKPENRLILQDGGFDLLKKKSNAEWIVWLVKNGPKLWTSNSNRKLTSKLLRELAGEIQILAPGNVSDHGDFRDKSCWRKYLNELVSEMMTVEVRCSAAVRDSGVFVLTTWPYSVFLELMAQEVSRKLI